MRDDGLRTIDTFLWAALDGLAAIPPRFHSQPADTKHATAQAVLEAIVERARAGEKPAADFVARHADRFNGAAASVAPAPVYIPTPPTPANAVTILLTVYHRPHTFLEQLAAIRRQTVQPAAVWVFANEPDAETIALVNAAGVDRVVTCSPNSRYHLRFAVAMEAQTPYICVLDDDAIPGDRWLENCLATMRISPGILGTFGTRQRSLDNYMDRSNTGWPEPSAEVSQVDWVGQIWFLRPEWIRFLFAERLTNAINGEDLELSCRAKRLGGVNSYVPPHPPGDKSLWGNVAHHRYNSDAVASFKRPTFREERMQIMHAERSKGWRPLVWSPPWEYVTLEQLAADTRMFAGSLPPISGVAGIPASGMFPATILANQLHVPLYELSARNGLRQPGGGLRKQGLGQPAGESLPLLVVDDCTWSGWAMRKAREVLARVAPERGRTAIFAAIYATGDADCPADLYHKKKPPYTQFFEWNLLNMSAGAAKHIALDFDGVLCHDPTAPEGADFGPCIATAKPLHLPRKFPVPLIVTARLERYRSETEAWLAKHGVTVEKLVMWDGSLEERDGVDLGTYKGKHYAASPCTLFVESDAGQTERIFQASGKAVLCPAAGRIWQ